VKATEAKLLDFLKRSPRFISPTNQRTYSSTERECRQLGRWGSGDVQVSLGESEELPYVLGLVRQAFEEQMGNGEAKA
jgi:hypothetical protein